MPVDKADRPRRGDELTPLLRGHSRNRDTEHGDDPLDQVEIVKFGENDETDPRHWPRRKKMLNVATISFMSIIPFLASSAFSPGIQQIADDLDTSVEKVVGINSAYLIAFGIGPLILAPLSESFGRRRLYLICFTIFTLLQIPTALSPNIQTLTIVRAFAGLFGSVSPTNGGGSISDLFAADERAGIFSWFLLGPLLGPSLGPCLGGLIVERLNWRWIYWLVTIISAITTVVAFLCVRETYAPVILAQRKAEHERDNKDSSVIYRIEDQDDRPLPRRLLASLQRPMRIFIQPIVLTMSTYQAIVFATTFSIYTNLQAIFSGEYGFNTEQVGLLYLAPGTGLLLAAWFIVPRIDTIYKRLTARNDGKAEPEFRLPIANIGSVLIPASLFWFAWTIDAHTHWAVPIASTLFYGIGQVAVFNSVQNYYIDAFEKHAASAIAAGSVFRSLVAGIVPLFVPGLLEKLGYGWGLSVFAFLALGIAPAPLVFFFYGARVRKAFPTNL